MGLRVNLYELIISFVKKSQIKHKVNFFIELYYFFIKPNLSTTAKIKTSSIVY